MPTWCCHDGRYYVVDYKTNWLGPLRADYARPRWAALLAESRYDLQAAIYLLALHRHLRERLPDYQCERHLGGALYLFCAAGTATATACGMPAPAPPRWTRWTSCLPGPAHEPRRICPPAAKDAP